MYLVGDVRLGADVDGTSFIWCITFLCSRYARLVAAEPANLTLKYERRVTRSRKNTNVASNDAATGNQHNVASYESGWRGLV